jgi:hypothetical protein
LSITWKNDFQDSDPRLLREVGDLAIVIFRSIPDILVDLPLTREQMMLAA